MAYTVPKLKDYSARTLDKAAEKLLAALDQESKAIKTEADWKTFRDRWLARKDGVLTQINELWLKAAPKEAKREVGQQVNKIKARVEEVVESVKDRLVQEVLNALDGDSWREGSLDITLPGTRRPLGAEHPVIKTTNEILSVFRNLGYSVQEGPVIETDYYNFESLNFPPNHPARDTQDTLFIANQETKPLRERLLLRTHTSPVQIRTMEKMKPPIRIVIPGKSPQRPARRQPLTDVSPDRGPGRRHEHHFRRLEGHARSRHEGAFRLERENQLPALVFPVHRT